MKATPLILDFDGSVLPLVSSFAAHETRLPLQEWQEAIRFGCTLSDFSRLEEHLRTRMPKRYGCVFTGSGDYHHLTLFLLRELSAKTPGLSFDVIVCDNHPDNMRYPFGLHCGSWVRHAAALPYVRHVHVLGITSEDIGISHAWENYFGPFLRKKLTYWSIGVNARWLGVIGRERYARRFANADALVTEFLGVLERSESVYLSLDKDVLSPEVALTNWDQGVFELRHLVALINACSGCLAGADITGDISEYMFKGRFKRLLSRLDGQEPPDPMELHHQQKDQQAVNLELLRLLENAGFPHRA